MSIATVKAAKDCDLIHANWTLSAAISLFSQIFHRRKVILTVQGSDIFQAAQMPLFRRLTKYVLTRCAKVVAISQSLADETAAIGLPRGGIEVIPNGVDTDFFVPSITPREDFILFVGSLFERKGVRYLIQAFSIIGDLFPNFSLAIIGEGAQEGELAQLASSLRISKRVQFLGPKSPEEVSDWMRRAKLFVLPSLEEGLGVVLLESLASATPCVGSNIGGIPDVLSKDVGILVPPKDPQSLAHAMQSILKDPGLWDSMSKAARLKAEKKYSCDEVAAKLIRSYEDALAQ
jgi:glycosyltransferase involved in cell wall biosynthesis